MDILLGMPWNETSGRRDVVARINEMDWVNSAAVMIDLWDSSLTSSEAAATACQAQSASNLASLLNEACSASKAVHTEHDKHAAASTSQREVLDARSCAGITVNVTNDSSITASACKQSNDCAAAALRTEISAASFCSSTYTLADGHRSPFESSTRSDEAALMTEEPTCADASPEQLTAAMQVVQGGSRAFVLARAMLKRAADTAWSK